MPWFEAYENAMQAHVAQKAAELKARQEAAAAKAAEVRGLLDAKADVQLEDGQWVASVAAPWDNPLLVPTIEHGNQGAGSAIEDGHYIPQLHRRHLLADAVDAVWTGVVRAVLWIAGVWR